MKKKKLLPKDKKLLDWLKKAGSKDSKKDFTPYQSSTETEKSYEKAIKEYASGKTIKVKDIDKFFEEL